MEKPILVTGSHLSGSTWIGRIIESAPGIKYIHEPFNVGIKRYQYKSPLKYWFEYIPPEADKEYQQKIISYLKTFYDLDFINLTRELSRIRSVRRLGAYLRDIKERVIKDRMLFKDPIAVLASEWMANTMNADIIISVRHPAAFVGSLKLKKWNFEFHNFAQQHSLITNYLQPFKEDIDNYVSEKKDVIDQGIMLWNIIYGVTKEFQMKYGEKWQIIKNEDLSADPVAQYKLMFDKLNLKFTSKVEKKILKSTGGFAYTKTRRDSKTNISTWKKRLTTEEIERVKEGTKTVWPFFYTGEDWSLDD